MKILTRPTKHDNDNDNDMIHARIHAATKLITEQDWVGGKIRYPATKRRNSKLTRF